MNFHLFASLLLLPYIFAEDAFFRSRIIRGRPFRGLVPEPLKENLTEQLRNVQQAYVIDSRLDHFDTQNTQTFKQRYWYNDQYFRAGGPVFIMLGAESGQSPSWISSTNLPWIQLGIENNAFLFLIEHRYYGQSVPAGASGSDRFKYLSSKQAIEDYAQFIVSMKAMFPAIRNSRWIAFGGSYGASLAAWLQELHPDLVYGAVASSGPIQAQVNFIQYMETIMRAINSYSKPCGDSVSSGFQQVAQLLTTANGRNTLKNTFNLCNQLDPNYPFGIQSFWLTIYNPYMNIVQYSGDNIVVDYDISSIAQGICRYHTNPSLSLMGRMQAVNNNYYSHKGRTTCLKHRFEDLKEWISKDDQAYEQNAWYWQTCTEFGWYQSTDSLSAGPWFGGVGTLPVSFFEKECTYMFGNAWNAITIRKAVENTNAYYGGTTNFTGTHVIFVNGDIDPWYRASILTSNNPSIVTILSQGSAHCADMFPARSTDPPGLTQARHTIRQTLNRWLRE